MATFAGEIEKFIVRKTVKAGVVFVLWKATLLCVVVGCAYHVYFTDTQTYKVAYHSSFTVIGQPTFQASMT